jgi:hypothetical protein
VELSNENYEYLIRRINSYLLLEPDWNSYKALPISKKVTDKAIEYLSNLPDEPWAVVPVSDGSIQFSLSKDGFNIEICIMDADL